MFSCCFPRFVSQNTALNNRSTTVQDSISLKDILLSISKAYGSKTYGNEKGIIFLSKAEFFCFQAKVDNKNCTAFNSLSVFIDGKRLMNITKPYSKTFKIELRDNENYIKAGDYKKSYIQISFNKNDHQLYVGTFTPDT